MKITGEAVAMGASAGGLEAVKTILRCLDRDFRFPIFVCLHVAPDPDSSLAALLCRATGLVVMEAEDKQPIEEGRVYVAPGGYHLLVEKDYTFSLSVDERVNYSRPSIDVLFESAADAYRERLVGVLLTGASADGAKGLKAIQDLGGVVLAQDPETASQATMPRSGIQSTNTKNILALEEIGAALARMSKVDSK